MKLIYSRYFSENEVEVDDLEEGLALAESIADAETGFPLRIVDDSGVVLKDYLAEFEQQMAEYAKRPEEPVFCRTVEFK